MVEEKEIGNDSEKIETKVVVELGRTRLPIDTLLGWSEGSLIELDIVSGGPHRYPNQRQEVGDGRGRNHRGELRRPRTRLREPLIYVRRPETEAGRPKSADDLRSSVSCPRSVLYLTNLRNDSSTTSASSKSSNRSFFSPSAITPKLSRTAFSVWSNAASSCAQLKKNPVDKIKPRLAFS